MTANDLPQGMTQNTISLLLGHPDPATLLTPEMRNAMQRVISSPQAYTALQYGPEQGTRGLIDFLVEKINREQGLSIQPGNLMVVAGSTHAVDMLARLYARPGGVMLVEAPSYVDALHIFRDQQVELCSIPMDEDGLIPSELEKQVAQLHSRGTFPSTLYTIPNFHNIEFRLDNLDKAITANPADRLNKVLPEIEFVDHRRAHHCNSDGGVDENRTISQPGRPVPVPFQCDFA